MKVSFTPESASADMRDIHPVHMNAGDSFELTICFDVDTATKITPSNVKRFREGARTLVEKYLSKGADQAVIQLQEARLSQCKKEAGVLHTRLHHANTELGDMRAKYESQDM